MEELNVTTPKHQARRRSETCPPDFNRSYSTFVETNESDRDRASNKMKGDNEIATGDDGWEDDDGNGQEDERDGDKESKRSPRSLPSMAVAIALGERDDLFKSASPAEGLSSESTTVEEVSVLDDNMQYFNSDHDTGSHVRLLIRPSTSSSGVLIVKGLFPLNVHFH